MTNSNDFIIEPQINKFRFFFNFMRLRFPREEAVLFSIVRAEVLENLNRDSLVSFI